MNWIDFFIMFILSFNIIKSTSLGLVKSIIVLLQFLLSIYLSKMYYSVVTGYIINTPVLYKGFESLIKKFISVLFFGKIIEESEIIIIFINIFSIILTFFFFKWIIGLLGGLISTIFKAPILKQLDKIGGFVIGIIKGMVVLYVGFSLISPLGIIYPQNVITKGLRDSLLSGLFLNQDLIFDFFKHTKI